MYECYDDDGLYVVDVDMVNVTLHMFYSAFNLFHFLILIHFC